MFYASSYVVLWYFWGKHEIFEMFVKYSHIVLTFDYDQYEIITYANNTITGSCITTFNIVSMPENDYFRAISIVNSNHEIYRMLL